MAASYEHAEASARHFGGVPEDYIKIHEFIDRSKRQVGDVRHRMLMHHTDGVWVCQEVFGRFINIHDEDGNLILGKTGKPVRVLVRDIAENHVTEDLGCIPSLADWCNNTICRAWMGGKRNKFIGREQLLDTPVDIPALERGTHEETK